jgi:hypothetical protein
MAFRENTPVRRVSAIAMACAALLSAASACTTGGTPLCDRAAAQAQKAQLTAAAASYAEAERKKEGDCAADGLGTVAGKQAAAITQAAHGQAAENAGDLTAARSRYQAAIGIDSGNGQAAAGLLRVTRRPAEVGPLWLPAQRLHDEGMDQAAQDEIVAVLKSHPDQQVPQSLTALASPHKPRPVTGAASALAADPSPAQQPRLGSWLTWSFLAAALLLAAALYALALLHGRSRQRYETGFADVGAKLNVLSHDLARADRRRAGGESALRAAVDAQRTDADRLLLSLMPKPDTETCAYLAADPPIQPLAGQTVLTDVRIYQAGEYLLLRRISSAVPDADLDWLSAALSGGDPAALRLVFGAELTERTFDPEWTGTPDYRSCRIPGSLSALLAELADGPGRWRPLVFGEVPDGGVFARPPTDFTGTPNRIVQLTAIITGEQRVPVYLCLRSLPQSVLAQAAARGVRTAFEGELSAAAATESALSLESARDARERERTLLTRDLAEHVQPAAPATPKPSSAVAAQPPRPITTAPVTGGAVSNGPILSALHAATPITAAPITAAPDTAGPEAAAPITATPDTASPEVAAPITAAPEAAGPGTVTDRPNGHPAGAGEHRQTVIRNGPAMRVERHDPAADDGESGHFVKADYPS